MNDNLRKELFARFSFSVDFVSLDFFVSFAEKLLFLLKQFLLMIKRKAFENTIINRTGFYIFRQIGSIFS